MEKGEALGPWYCPLADLISPILGRTLNEGVIWLLVNEIDQEMLQITLVLLEIFKQSAYEII